MPMGFDSLIGDMGSALSMGQQQRILLARALYKKPKILFLDEGTAHIDAESEDALFREIVKMNITCVFTTHKMDLFEFADQILIFEKNGVSLTHRSEAKSS